MLHYHGTPLSSHANAAKVLTGRHALVSFATAGDALVAVCAEVCQSLVGDCGAFTSWRSGNPITDWTDCYRWYERLLKFPNCDWAIIPDVIDGDEDANDALLAAWPFGASRGVPVWHYHESLDRLGRLCAGWPRVALGSSGEYAAVGSPAWWRRTDEAMGVACDSEGYPHVKLHGLRMLDPDVFRRLPLASADSCNAGRNCGAVGERLNLPPDAAAEVIIRRIESNNAAARWSGLPKANEYRLFESVA
jgi:hypothetical protein